MEIDNWEAPSYNLPVKEFIVKKGGTLYIPAGCAVGFKLWTTKLFLEYPVEKSHLENMDLMTLTRTDGTTKFSCNL